LLFWMVCIGDAPVPDFDIETEQLYFLNYICSNVINPRANIIQTIFCFCPVFQFPTTVSISLWSLRQRVACHLFAEPERWSWSLCKTESMSEHAGNIC
jgi:hypothetical protein